MSKLEDKLQESTATTAFQLVWNAIKGTGQFIANEEAIERGMRKYAKNFLDRHGQIKILGMADPVALRDIYTAAQVVSPGFLHRFYSTHDLQQEVFRIRLASSKHVYPKSYGSFSAIDSDELLEELLEPVSRRGFFPTSSEVSRRPGLELANEVQFLNILGAPGAGKSTLLRRIGLEALLPRSNLFEGMRTSLGLKPALPDGGVSAYQHNCLPVFIELRRFRVETPDLFQLIQQELSTCGLPESEKLAKSLLGSGRLVLLLDGLDEIPEEKLDVAISHVRDFVDRHSENRFVMSCRTAFYKSYLSRFSDVLLADFDDGQIANFAHNWFRSERDRELGTAEEFLELLHKPSFASAKELASTPLLLTFLCLTYDDRQRLETNRSILYREALQILINRWASSKRVHNNPVYQALHAELEVQMLADFVAPAYRDNRYFFYRREVVDHIAKFLREELNAPTHLDGDKVLESIEVQQGLLVLRARDVYSFSHLTLQEYLTAVWYVTNQKQIDLVRENLFNTRWREVFVLVAGLLGKSDEFFGAMIETAEDHLKSLPQAMGVMRWAATMLIPSEDEAHNAAGRALLVALALGRSVVHSRALALGRSLGGEVQFKIADGIGRLRAADIHIDKAHSLVSVQSVDSGISSFTSYLREGYFPLLRVFESVASYRGDWSEAIHRLDVLHEVMLKQEAFSSKDAKLMLLQAQDVFGEALGLPPDLRQLGTECKRVLERYLTAVGLLVDCKNAAMRISRSTWSKICAQLCGPVN